MSFAEFHGSGDKRRRYWARSAVGWRFIDESVPNAAHYALVRLEETGIASGLITQNVDRLHQRAGNREMIKPDVVFFGENLPKQRVDASYAAVEAGDALLVLWSSLTVYLGFRFADHAVKQGRFPAIINRGPTSCGRTCGDED